MSLRLYPIELTWDEIDQVMSSLRYHSACIEARPFSHVDEQDQHLAMLWELVHRLGDARRVVWGETQVLPPRDAPVLVPDDASALVEGGT